MTNILATIVVCITTNFIEPTVIHDGSFRTKEVHEVTKLVFDYNGQTAEVRTKDILKSKTIQLLKYEPVWYDLDPSRSAICDALGAFTNGNVELCISSSNLLIGTITDFKHVGYKHRIIQ